MKMEKKNNGTKKEYTKPTVKSVEWNFNEAVCQTAITNSPTKCLNITKGGGTTVFENRDDINAIGTWERVGSR